VSYRFAIIEDATGIVIRTGAVSQPDNMAIQARAGELAVALDRNDVLPNGLWQYVGGEFTEIAPQPPSFEVLHIEAYLALDSIASVRLNLWQGANAPAGGLQVDDTSMGRISMWVTQAIISNADGSPFALEYWIMADNSHLAIADADADAFLALATN
jgi:hypothetical protein